MADCGRQRYISVARDQTLAVGGGVSYALAGVRYSIYAALLRTLSWSVAEGGISYCRPI